MQVRKKLKTGFALHPENINREGSNRKFFRIQNFISDEMAEMYVMQLHRLAMPVEEGVTPDFNAIKLLLAYKAGQPKEHVSITREEPEDYFEKLDHTDQKQLEDLYNKARGIVKPE